MIIQKYEIMPLIIYQIKKYKKRLGTINSKSYNLYIKFRKDYSPTIEVIAAPVTGTTVSVVSDTITT